MNFSIRDFQSVPVVFAAAVALTWATLPNDSFAGTVTRYEILTSPSQLDGSGTIILAGNNGVSQGIEPVTVAATGGDIEFRPDSELGGVMGIVGQGTYSKGGLSPPTVTDPALRKVVWDQGYSSVGNGNGGLSITVPGLTVGLLSRIQMIWTTYSQPDRTYAIEVEGDNFAVPVAGTHLWVYEWTATDTVANLSLLTDIGGSQISGFVVSQVPEPSSLALFGIAVTSLIGFTPRLRCK